MRSGWKVEHNIIAQIRELLSVYIENWTLPTARDFVDVGVLCTFSNKKVQQLGLPEARS